MVKITIEQQLKDSWPQVSLGCIQCRVTVQPSSDKLLEEIAHTSRHLKETLSMEQIKTREHIAQTRACCTALGKEVNRYRNSSEAMHRRILKDRELYQINNVVEVNNLISIQTGYSLGTYDVDCLTGTVHWGVTGQGVHYQGIGKDAVNIEFLPVLWDDEGYFGNPNSDSTRAMITEKTQKILLCVYAFGGTDDLEQVLSDTAAALRTYCGAQEIEQKIIQ